MIEGNSRNQQSQKFPIQKHFNTRKIVPRYLSHLICICLKGYCKYTLNHCKAGSLTSNNIPKKNKKKNSVSSLLSCKLWKHHCQCLWSPWKINIVNLLTPPPTFSIIYPQISVCYSVQLTPIVYLKYYLFFRQRKNTVQDTLKFMLLCKSLILLSFMY